MDVNINKDLQKFICIARNFIVAFWAFQIFSLIIVNKAEFLNQCTSVTGQVKT